MKLVAEEFRENSTEAAGGACGSHRQIFDKVIARCRQAERDDAGRSDAFSVFFKFDKLALRVKQSS